LFLSALPQQTRQTSSGPSRAWGPSVMLFGASQASQGNMNNPLAFGWQGATGGRTGRGAGVVVWEGIAPDTQEIP
jgi:hypothetical protein